VSRRNGPPDRHCVAEPPPSGSFFKNGVAQGITLFSVHPDSFFFQLGLRAQDLLLRLNGIPLNSPEGALEAYALVLKASRVELELERGGRLLRHTYIIKG
jgi:general secretion pathway protein C